MLTPGLGPSCIVALGRFEEIDPHTLRRAFARSSPRSSLSIEYRDDPTASQGYSISIDGHLFGVGLFDGTIPPPAYPLDPLTTLFWRRAPEEIADHQAFMVISAAERYSAIGLSRAQSTALTRLCAALVEECPALGVYWTDAVSCASPERVARAPDDIARGDWPVDIWIGFRYFGDHGPDQSVLGLQTQGAERYLGFEIQVRPFVVQTLKEPLHILLGAVCYLMNYGDVIKDGTIVEVPGERLMQFQLHLGMDGRPELASLSVLEDDHRALH